ncbi:MAG: hypothetical protein IJA85_01010 [Clostridia bacterium]|nr:hypothetical protein [Clostridia bacterium]
MIFIGVDGGGTKTALAAYESGSLIAKAKSGPMNYNFIGADAASENLISGIRALKIPAEQIAAIGIGDPSLDDGMPAVEDSPTARFAAAVKGEIDAPVYIRSDAYITLFGLTGGAEPAVLMLSGTGAMGIAEDADRNIKVVGGWGRLTGDEGSGYYIAIEAIKAALHASDGIEPETMLTEAVLRHFGVDSPRRLIDIFYGEEEADIASFAKTAADCAEKGDRRAKEILLNAARYLASYTSTLMDWNGSRKVGVYGSVICGNTIVRSEFESILRSKYGDVSISEPPVSAEMAAALYAELMYNDERN